MPLWPWAQVVFSGAHGTPAGTQLPAEMSPLSRFPGTFVGTTEPASPPLSSTSPTTAAATMPVGPSVAGLAPPGEAALCLEEVTPPASGTRKARVLYDYEAADSSELALLADEVGLHRGGGGGGQGRAREHQGTRMGSPHPCLQVSEGPWGGAGAGGETEAAAALRKRSLRRAGGEVNSCLWRCRRPGLLGPRQPCPHAVLAPVLPQLWCDLPSLPSSSAHHCLQPAWHGP